MRFKRTCALVLVFALNPMESSKASASWFGSNVFIGGGQGKTLYSETQTNLLPTNPLDPVVAPTSGTLSAVNLDIGYEMFSSSKISYTVSGLVPVLGQSAQRLLVANLALNYYFNTLGTQFALSDGMSTLNIAPRWSYYAGLRGGVAYFVYLTETSQKSDMFFDLGLLAGLKHSLGKVWGLKAELSISRGLGVQTESLSTRYALGVTYTIGH